MNEKFKDSLKVVLAQYSCEIAPYLYEDIKKEIENTFDGARNNEITKLEFMDCMNVKRYKTINKYINLFEAELERRWAEEDKMKVN